MRIHALDLADLCPGHSDQVVPNANLRLPHHFYIVMEQQVEMFEDGAGQAVLNGDRGGIGSARVERGKHLCRKRAGKNLRIRHELQRGFVAE
jgi:hypothetical protein